MPSQMSLLSDVSKKFLPAIQIVPVFGGWKQRARVRSLSRDPFGLVEDSLSLWSFSVSLYFKPSSRHKALYFRADIMATSLRRSRRATPKQKNSDFNVGDIVEVRTLPSIEESRRQFAESIRPFSTRSILSRP